MVPLATIDAPSPPNGGRRQKSVALLVETSNEYARGLLRGIIAYVRAHRPWTTYLAEHGRGDQPPAWLSKWNGDGIIARVENPRIAKAVVATGLPAVDVSAANLVPGIPWVETDDSAIARLAFDHLADRGFRQFGYVGDERFNWSNWRRDRFVGFAKARGTPCAVTHSTLSDRAGAEWTNEIRKLAAWLSNLPKPVGIMACYDLMGRQVLEACRHAGLKVPDDVAVVGVDDDELICELSDPPLSSVAPDTRQTGYEAAAFLDRLMSGQQVGDKPRLIAPLGVVTRVSSDVLALEDSDVSAAVQFIREHACQRISVKDVLEQVPLSRRVLEARFKKLIGRTPHDEIDRVRLERVRSLLRETDLSIAEVARKAGFEHAEYLSVVFRKKMGVTPVAYRRQHRGESVVA